MGSPARWWRCAPRILSPCRLRKPAGISKLCGHIVTWYGQRAASAWDSATYRNFGFSILDFRLSYLQSKIESRKSKISMDVLWLGYDGLSVSYRDVVAVLLYR